MLKFIALLLILPGLTFADELKLMTWNVYMLPKPIKNSHQKDRSQAIADQLKASDYDVIFLQEAFSWYFRSTVKEALKDKFPHYSRLKKKFGIYPFFSPGLVAFSKYPMKKIDHTYFSKCEGADCYSSKGVQLLEITLPSGKSIQIANTHMQAGSQEKHAQIRKIQLGQIRDLLLKNKKDGIPQLLVGDLNINSLAGKEFPVAIDTLQMKPVSSFELADQLPEEETEDPTLAERIRNFFTAGFLASCLKEDESDNPKLLDHVLYVDTDQKMKIMNDEVGNPEFMLKGKSCPLSDHKPRIVTLEL